MLICIHSNFSVRLYYGPARKVVGSGSAIEFSEAETAAPLGIHHRFWILGTPQ